MMKLQVGVAHGTGDKGHQCNHLYRITIPTHLGIPLLALLRW